MSTTQITLRGTPKDRGRLIYCFKCCDFAFDKGSVELVPGDASKVLCFEHWHQRQRSRQMTHLNRYTKDRK